MRLVGRVFCWWFTGLTFLSHALDTLTLLDFTSAVALLQQHNIQHLVDVAEQNGCEYRGACCVRMTVCSLCFVESRQCDCSVVVWRGQHDTYGRACDV